jgi:hypothetical protein
MVEDYERRFSAAASCAGILGSGADAIAAAAIAFGPEAALEPLELASELPALAVRELDGAARSPHDVADVVAAINAAECCGAPDWALPVDAARRWIEGVRPAAHVLPEPLRLRLALAACACGIPARAPTFGSREAFVAQLAAAELEHEVDFPDFVEDFPAQLAARRMSWGDLLLAARVVYQRGGVPVGRVAETLIRAVRS